jgi:DNA-binding transcriptional MocR family regulator
MQVDWLKAIKFTGDTPKHRVLTDALLKAIEAGDLPEGCKLPTHRELAYQLRVSVQTVSTSYREALKRGYIRSEVGRGSFVRSMNSEPTGGFLLDSTSSDLVDLSIIRGVYTEAHETASRQVMAAMALSDNSQWMRPCRPIPGQDHHREAAQTWLAQLSVRTEVERICITNGATHAILLALAAVTRPGDIVLTEELTEHGFIGMANVLGLTLRCVQTDQEGIIPEALDAACADGSAKALVWIPTLGNPTSHFASAKRRDTIAQVAASHGIFVIENEVYRPLVDDRPPSIIDLLPDHGFLATSMTKAVLTGLRVGYLVAPHKFALRVASLLRITSWTATPIAAEIASRWIESRTTEHLAMIQRSEAMARQAILQETLEPFLAGSHPQSLFGWLKIPPGWTEESLVAVLRERRIAVTTSSPFVVDKNHAQKGIRVCLGGRISPEVLRSALQTIRDTFMQLPAINPISV